jgi:hypothetical protein
MEGSSLSEPAVIGLLNSQFIPILADVDVYGFPEGMPALEKYRKMWHSFEKHKWGIATSAVVNPSGSQLLAESGSGFFWQWKSAANYNPDKFLSYLQKALDKGRRMAGKDDNFSMLQKLASGQLTKQQK